jgi:1-acyl-sn-glycerol-3-phosphate acyltransferase
MPEQGFVKYALQHGYKIYPCYTFGEEKTYWQLLPVRLD